ncbi:hypothetical protein [Nocardioides daeguensis]|uniref:hypothetical protein n=1 Tax=Nocardioides daeguensis TaxID=908359 RepID=UPI001C46A796|nr:hypothetical protein [Nocardioides daeguensis]MCR1773386.1 hypothetical protein [Nocardioides daeguensis]
MVKTDGLSTSERVELCRELLALAAPDVATFETDIPWSMAAEWPTEVREAAEHLSSLRTPKRGEDRLYRRTGVRQNGEVAVWDAFVAFAPYSFDASAWAPGPRRLVALADCAQSIAVDLTRDQIALLSTAVEARLVPTRR